MAGVGIFSATYGALLALTETDIKRTLAYSTMSQLGYMMAALGAGGLVAGVFHLITHGFFKSLLFLAAGSVIHGAGTQDVREMGGLFRKMPKTAITLPRRHPGHRRPAAAVRILQQGRHPRLLLELAHARPDPRQVRCSWAAWPRPC